MAFPCTCVSSNTESLYIRQEGTQTETKRPPNHAPLNIQVVWLCCLALLFSFPARSETLTIPGSGNPEYILGVLAREFNERQSSHTIVVPPTIGTAGAIRELSEGNASLGRIGRPLKESERSLGFTYFSLGRDPIVFVAGAGVNVRTVTREQVLGIYSGKITDWQAIGANPAPIRAIGRESTDASYRGIARAIDSFNGISYGSAVKLVHLDSQLLELLDRFPSSFGFLNRSALSAAKTRLTPLALDNIEATPENLRSGRYPLWTEIGLIYKEKTLSEAGRSFINFIASPSGLEILRAHGLVTHPKQ